MIISLRRIARTFVLLLPFAALLIVFNSHILGGPESQRESKEEAVSTIYRSNAEVDQQVFDLDGFHIFVAGTDTGKTRASRISSGKGKHTSTSNGSIQQKEKICNVPKLSVNGSEVIEFFKKSPKIVCNKPQNWAYVNEDGFFSLVESRVNAKCTVSSVLRIDDDHVKNGEKIEIKHGQKLPSDFVHVKCSMGSEHWKGMLATVVRDEALVSRRKAVTHPPDWSGLDIYFLGLDSVSQMTYRRKLPKTVNFFEKEMGAVVLDAYNIVGDGTPQAFIPILTAATEEELPLTRKRFKNAHYVDDVYPFIWKNFSDAGYVTLYGEDAANVGTFTYRLKGFREQPTDHFTRTFFQEHERVSSGTCSGSESIHKMWFRYCNAFMREYKDLPRFLLMHLSMFSHDDINQVGGLDEDLESHLRQMTESGLLDNALVVMMADHGHRFAKLRNTHQGQLEERLPFFGFSLPRKYREGRMKTAWENLLKNKGVLSTPFDIHATLMDALHFPKEEELNIVQDSNKRSLSLFRSLPLSRECAQADVAPHWCTCLNWQDALVGDDIEKMQRMSLAVVGVINAQTEPERTLCAPLSLKKIIYAKRMVPNESLLKYKNVKDADGFVPDLSGSTKMDLLYYQLKLVTTPGDAEYEVTLHHEVSKNNLYIDLTSISHSNQYGDRPHCIIDKNYFLATYCVCYDKI